MVAGAEMMLERGNDWSTAGASADGETSRMDGSGSATARRAIGRPGRGRGRGAAVRALERFVPLTDWPSSRTCLLYRVFESAGQVCTDLWAINSLEAAATANPSSATDARPNSTPEDFPTNPLFTTFAAISLPPPISISTTLTSPLLLSRTTRTISPVTDVTFAAIIGPATAVARTTGRVCRAESNAVRCPSVCTQRTGAR